MPGMRGMMIGTTDGIPTVPQPGRVAGSSAWDGRLSKASSHRRRLAAACRPSPPWANNGSMRSRKPLQKCCKQHVGIQRLGNEVIHACREAVLNYLWVMDLHIVALLFLS